jgi:hypothetical protein
VKARERDLEDGAPAGRFGNAVTKCEGYTPDCVQFGRCMQGGDCFSSSPNLVAARMVESLIPNDGRAGMHLAYLRKVAEMLRSDSVYL